MRIFNEEERLHTNLNTISYFEMNEYNYYSKNNVRKFTYKGIEYLSLYRRLNVQLVVTNACPYDCSFCIEKINPANSKKENFNADLQLKNLKELLLIMKKAGLEPTVSITGGEPTLYLDHIINIAKMLDDIGVMYNLNTSGYSKNSIIYNKFKRINLSVHSADVDKNSRVFCKNRGEYWKNEIYKDATIQRVILNGDYEELIAFLNSFDQKRFSIRFVARSKNEKSFDWKPLFDKIKEDPDFKFIQQKIGDYYFFEEYKYKNNKTIRFSFADMEQLKYYKDKMDKEQNFVRAAIVLADGTVKFDWINSKENEGVLL